MRAKEGKSTQPMGEVCPGALWDVCLCMVKPASDFSLAKYLMKIFLRMLKIAEISTEILVFDDPDGIIALLIFCVDCY